MADKRHIYRVSVEWTGNRGFGTSAHHRYDRDHMITSGTKPPIVGSSDPAFRGDQARWNPEELLLASISACHKLWYLGLCAKFGVSVVSYQDNAEGTMVEEPNGAGRFISAVLRPQIVIHAGEDIAKATRLHHDAHEYCFIANSLNFPVTWEPAISLQ